MQCKKNKAKYQNIKKSTLVFGCHLKSTESSIKEKINFF